MGDFDVTLIKEFARHQGLYDRNSPFYKDKMYVIQSWNEMSQKLGFDVRLLKERMLQLRNRFNLEKRRIDDIHSKYPNRIVRSQWPLYFHMNFMAGHIRHRRSFSKMTARQQRQRNVDVGERSSLVMTRIHSNNPANRNSNPTKTLNNSCSSIEIKCENTMESEEDLSTANMDQVNHLMDNNAEIPKNSPRNGSSVRSSTAILPHQEFEGIRIKEFPMTVKTNDGDNAYQYYNRNSQTTQVQEMKDIKQMTRVQKFESFGKFIAMSLADIPDNVAMKLVEKFTGDLVKAVLNTDDVLVSSRPIIRSVETIVKQQEETPEKNVSSALPSDDNNPPSNSTTENFNGFDEYDDQVIYDLTEDGPSNV